MTLQDGHCLFALGKFEHIGTELVLTGKVWCFKSHGKEIMAIWCHEPWQRDQQPEGVTVEHRVWTSDGVAASLTSLGCLVVLQAARGELEASGRGALHGHWEIWGVS